MATGLSRFDLGMTTLCYGERKLKLRSGQLTTATIGKVFHLFPDSIVLISTDGALETPDDTGTFFLDDICGEYIVEGDTTSPKVVEHKATVTSAVSTHKKMPQIKGGHMFKRPFHQADQHESGPSQAQRCKETEWRKNIDVVELKKGQLKKISNFPVSLTPSTANIECVSNQLSSEVPEFEGSDIVLIDNGNYKIPDSSATKGLKYWKSSRRVKAMKLDQFEEFLESQDFEEPLIKTPRGSIPELPYHRASTQRGKGKGKKRIDDGDDDYNFRIDLLESKLNLMHSEIESRKEQADEECTREIEVKLTDEQSKVQELQNALQIVKDHLQCLICKSLLAVDVVLFPCCNQMACKICAGRWIDEALSCPHCRAITRRDNLIDVRQLQPVLEKLAEPLPISFHTVPE